MKRPQRFYIDDADRRLMEAAASQMGTTSSEFVRQAVIEKVEREEVMTRLKQAREQLQEATHELRVEVGRLRTDMLDGHAKSLDQIHELVAKSAQRNERANHQFLKDLAGALGGGSDGVEPHHDDMPMSIPG